MDNHDVRLVNFLQSHKPVSPIPSADSEARLMYLISHNTSPTPPPKLLKYLIGCLAVAIMGLGYSLIPKPQLQVAKQLTEQERTEIVGQLIQDLSLPELAESANPWLESNAEL